METQREREAVNGGNDVNKDIVIDALTANPARFRLGGACDKVGKEKKKR